MPAGAHDARRDRTLRAPHRVLGRRHRDRHGVRSGLRLPRTAGAGAGRAAPYHCPPARRTHRNVRRLRPAAARRPRRVAAYPGGRPECLPAPAHHAARGRQDRSGQRHAAGRRAGGRQHHRRAPRQAVAVRIVGLPGGVGRGARPVLPEPPGRPAPGPDDLPAGARQLPHRREQPGLAGLDGGGDPLGVERARGVVCHHGRVAQDRANAGSRAGNRPG